MRWISKHKYTELSNNYRTAMVAFNETLKASELNKRMESEIFKSNGVPCRMLLRDARILGDEDIRIEPPNTIVMVRCVKVGPSKLHLGFNKPDEVRVGLLRKRRTIGLHSIVEGCTFLNQENGVHYHMNGEVTLG